MSSPESLLPPALHRHPVELSEPMRELLEREKLGQQSNVELSPQLADLLKDGFKVVDGRYLWAWESSPFPPGDDRDEIDDEAFLNHVHLEDALEILLPWRPWRATWRKRWVPSTLTGRLLLEQALLLTASLADALQEAFPGMAFQVVVTESTREEDPNFLDWIVRFHRVREGRPSWPSGSVVSTPGHMLAVTVGDNE